MFSTLTNNTPEQLFWQWFEKNSAELMNFESDQEEIFDELAAEPDGDRVGLILYIKGLSAENEDSAAQASFILLDSALGEYVVEEKIGFIEIIALPDDPKVFSLHPFASIREIVENQAH